MAGDNTEYFQVLKRMHKSAHKRVIDGDIADYQEYLELIKEVNRELTTLLSKMYEQGFTIVEIGRQLGVSKQAIHKALKSQKRRNKCQETTGLN